MAAQDAHELASQSGQGFWTVAWPSTVPPGPLGGLSVLPVTGSQQFFGCTVILYSKVY